MRDDDEDFDEDDASDEDDESVEDDASDEDDEPDEDDPSDEDDEPDEDDGDLEHDRDEDDGELLAREGELTPVPYSCAACGEENETLLDLAGGYSQAYTEDCAVCCRPNLLRIDVEPESMRIWIGAELEYD